MSDSYEHVLIEDQAQWQAWLDANHVTSPGIWLAPRKRAVAGPRSLTTSSSMRPSPTAVSTAALAADAARNIRANQWRQPAGRQPPGPAPP